VNTPCSSPPFPLPPGTKDFPMLDHSSTDIPTDIQAHTNRLQLAVQWSDETRNYPYVFLRSSCQCAHCVDEWTGQQLLDPTTIPPDITIEKLELVGNYALRIRWSDGHQAGLTTWQRLRALNQDAL